jgi:antitoxin component YwqK of YwqJK toxin-antitoxin module
MFQDFILKTVYGSCYNNLIRMGLYIGSLTNETRGGISNMQFAEFRTNMAIILDITDKSTNNKINICKDENYVYTVGEKLTVDHKYEDSKEKWIKYYLSEMPAYYDDLDLNNYTGDYIKWHENGQKKLTGKWIGGEKHGVFEEWNSFGTRISKSNWFGGLQHGLVETWYDNGSIIAQKCCAGYWNQGMKVGIHYSWYPITSENSFSTGQIMSREYWNPIDGKPTPHKNGLHESWFPGEKRETYCMWTEGKKHGIQVKWFSTGSIKKTGYWYKGLRIGLHSKWHPNGLLQKTGNWIITNEINTQDKLLNVDDDFINCIDKDVILDEGIYKQNILSQHHDCDDTIMDYDRDELEEKFILENNQQIFLSINKPDTINVRTTTKINFPIIDPTSKITTHRIPMGNLIPDVDISFDQTIQYPGINYEWVSVKNGLHEEWYINGKLSKWGLWEDGNKTGEHKLWDIDGNLFMNGKWSSGKLVSFIMN